MLADYNIPSVSGNFTMVTKRILEKIPAQNAKMSYMYDRHIFHYVVEDGLVYMTMADEAFGRRIPFAFLEDIKNRFKAAYLRVPTSVVVMPSFCLTDQIWRSRKDGRCRRDGCGAQAKSCGSCPDPRRTFLACYLSRWITLATTPTRTS